VISWSFFSTAVSEVVRDSNVMHGDRIRLATGERLEVMLRKIFLVCMALVTLTGCGTTKMGNQAANDFGRYTQLEKGATTKAEVYEIFGHPADVNYKPDGSSDWNIVSIQSQIAGATFIPFIGLLAGGNQQDIRVTTFQFDPQGKFQSVQTYEHRVYANQWASIARAVDSSGDPAFERVESEMLKLRLNFDKNAVVPPKLIEMPNK
jgi:hypothetical protein